MKRFWLVLCLIVTGGLSTSASTLLYLPYTVDTKIIGVLPSQHLEFEGLGRARLWGIIPLPGYEAFIVRNFFGEGLRCEPAGETYTRETKFHEAEVRVLDCGVYPRSSSFTGSLQGQLIANGVAKEFCSEAQNHFRTCFDPSQWYVP